MLTGNKGHYKVIHVNNSPEMTWKQSSVRDAIANSTLFIIVLLFQTLGSISSSMPVCWRRLEGRTHMDYQEAGFVVKSVFQKYKLYRKQNVTENSEVIEAKQKPTLFKMCILLPSTRISMTGDEQRDTQSDTSQNVNFPWQVV